MGKNLHPRNLTTSMSKLNIWMKIKSKLETHFFSLLVILSVLTKFEDFSSTLICSLKGNERQKKVSTFF